jgi:hypothetical protein
VVEGSEGGMMPPQGKYIYGIIAEPQLRRFGFPGVEDAEVYTVNYDGIAAIVSDTQLQEIDPIRKNVHTHTVVQDELLKEYTLLPMGFGMIAASEDEVQRLLEKNYEGLVHELNRLAGKVEVEVKVFWDREAVIKELQGENQELTKLKSKIRATLSSNEAQRLLIEAGKLVERIVMDWKARYAERVCAILGQLALDTQLNNSAGIENLLNASFLIEKPRECVFKEEVYRLDSEFRGKVNFKYVGPLPPYNFINLKLEPLK